VFGRNRQEGVLGSFMATGKQSATKGLALLRNAHIQQIEKLRKEIFQIDEKIKKEDQIEDPTLLHSIEKLRSCYDKGDFAAMIPLIAKANEQLQADRYFVELKSSDVEVFEDLKRYPLPQALRIARYGYYSLPMVIGGLPGCRKTSIAVEMAFQDFKSKRPFAFFSFELTMHQLFAKFLQHQIFESSGGSHHIAKLTEWTMKHQKEFKEFREEFFQYAHIIEAKGYSGARIVNVYERLKTAHSGLQVCYIDYFQRIKPDVTGGRGGKEETRVGYMNTSRFLTDSCKGTDSVFVVLSQMNNTGEFKETGAILEDAGLAFVIEKKDREFTLHVKKDRFDGQWGEAKIQFEPTTGVMLI